MGELKYIGKGDKTVNGQYRFVSHDMVTQKIHPLLVKYGINVCPSVEMITQEGNRTQIKLNVSFVNIDNNESFTTQWAGYGIDSGDKGPGKAISYAYKYCILKTFCLETGDDPDNDAQVKYKTAEELFDEKIAEKDTATKDMIRKFMSYSTEKAGLEESEVKKSAIKNFQKFMNAVRMYDEKQKLS